MADDSSTAVPADIQQQYPDLIALIQQSESMNDEERRYWLDLLPVMTGEQIERLKDILEKEQRELAAIDRKYAEKAESLSSEEFLQKTQQQRQKRRSKRKQAEQAARAQEQQKAQQILEEIEEL